MLGMLANLVNSGCDALDAGDNDLAIELLEMPADLGFGNAMFNIAIAYKRRGDLDEAIRWYQAAAEAGDIDAMAYLGWVLQLLGDLEGSRLVWQSSRERARRRWDKTEDTSRRQLQCRGGDSPSERCGNGQGPRHEWLYGHGRGKLDVGCRRW